MQAPTWTQRLAARWLDLIGLLTLGVVAGLIFYSFRANDQRQWWSALVVVAIGVTIIWDVPQHHLWLNNVRVLVATLLSVVLLFLGANLTGIIILYFIMSASAMVALPAPQGYRWIGVFGLLTLIYVVVVWGAIVPAILAAVGIFTGYLFVGSSVSAQRRAEVAQAQSQRLLHELQNAHRQMQQAARQAEELAVAEERNRLAREVHDTLGHRLTVAAVQLEGAQRLIARDPDKAAHMVGTVRQQVLEGLSELRRTVATLRAPLTADLSLPSAINRLVHDFQDATGIQTHLYLADAPVALPGEQREALFRAVQEGLTNVQKHAQAHTVWVRLDITNGSVQVSVEDDGVGLTRSANQPGFGLRGLDERAAQLGGRFTVTQGEHHGTLLVFCLPDLLSHLGTDGVA
jgi:signal transduction histidine kinase